MLKEKIKGRQVWLNAIAHKFWIRSDCRKSQNGFVDVEKCLQCPHFVGVRVGGRKLYVFCSFLSPNLTKSFKEKLIKVKSLQKLHKMYNELKYTLLKRDV